MKLANKTTFIFVILGILSAIISSLFIPYVLSYGESLGYTIPPITTLAMILAISIIVMTIIALNKQLFVSLITSTILGIIFFSNNIDMMLRVSGFAGLLLVAGYGIYNIFKIKNTRGRK